MIVKYQTFERYVIAMNNPKRNKFISSSIISNKFQIFEKYISTKLLAKQNKFF